MKHFNKIIISILMLWMLLASVSSFLIYKRGNNEQEKGYNIDINRIKHELSKGKSYKEIDLSKYEYVQQIHSLYLPASTEAIYNFYEGKDILKHIRFYIMPIIKEGEIVEYIRFEYITNNAFMINDILILYNVFLAIIVLGTIALLFYIRQEVLKPFHEILDMPYELSKGHLNTRIKEHKSRLFGKFLWGLDLLRENLETHKRRELQLQKEKKTLILSISHDIKTPVSTIKLYAKALYDNLYDTEEKRREVAMGIEAKADQIEGFVGEIISNSTEEILDIRVNCGEFYLNELVEKIHKAYDEKMNLLKIDFQVEPYDDILLKGDIERLIEVVENILENAIKYGDGIRIGISFGEEDYCKLITITNTGIPIPQTEFIHMFESFWRGANAHEKTGSGLGLYICKEIMKKMDGDIYAVNTSNSMGITLVVRYSE